MRDGAGRRLAATEQRIAHRIEEAARRLLGGLAAALQFLNAGVGAFQGFILNENGLDQRIECVGCLPLTLCDRCFGFGIALRAFDPGQAAEQVVNQLAFLRGHGVLSHLLCAVVGGA